MRSLHLGPALLTVLISTTAAAEPQVTENTLHYRVEGQTGQELLASLDRNSPVRQQGRVFHAYTGTRVNWRFYWRTTPGACRLTTINTTVKVHLTLPRLGDAPGPVRALWARWYPRLERHERQHAQHAVDTARRIEAALQALPAAPDCRTLEQQANETGYRLIETLQQTDQAYDRRTDHGRTEGARFSDYLR